MTPGEWESKVGPAHLTALGFALSSFAPWRWPIRNILHAQGISDQTIDKVAHREVVTFQGSSTILNVADYLVDFKSTKPPSKPNVMLDWDVWERYCYLDGKFGPSNSDLARLTDGVMLLTPGPAPSEARFLIVGEIHVEPPRNRTARRRSKVVLSKDRDFRPISDLAPPPPPAYVLTPDQHRYSA